MAGKNRHGVAEHKEFILVEDSFLVFRQIVETEKTWPFVDVFISHICQGTFDSSGIVLNVDGKCVANNFPCHDIFQGLVALRQIRPRFFLLRQEFHAKLGKRLHVLSPFEVSEYFCSKKCGIIGDISLRISSR